MPDLLPEQFLDVAGHLYFDAPPMHYSMLREHVRNELGDDPEDLFDEFEPKAFAAASLGQVHRARLKGSGQQVAVKIQYPNIARTIQDDIRNLTTLMFPMRLSNDWENLKSQTIDIAAMLNDEADYRREAENQKYARSLFSEDDGIVVPRVHDEYSTQRILTMDYLDGLHLDAYLRTNPSQNARDRYGENIFKSGFRTWYAGRMTYADPHPGNYVFLQDGRLGLIDFGCCRRFTDEDWAYLSHIEEVFEKDDGALRTVLAESVELPVERIAVEKDRFDLLVAYTNWIWEPLRAEGVFDFAAGDYLERGMAIYGQVVRKRYTRSKPVNTWIGRCFIGTRVLAYQLKSRFDARSLFAEERKAGQA
jgi:predicted unusual protein kinase regulating ubiquinone biosynthesis (AarF/ABC1/UbiB family)